MSPEQAQLLLPKLTDEQLATLSSYGVTEQTSVGQVLAVPGDLTRDLIIVAWLDDAVLRDRHGFIATGD